MEAIGFTAVFIVAGVMWVFLVLAAFFVGERGRSGSGDYFDDPENWGDQ